MIQKLHPGFITLTSKVTQTKQSVDGVVYPTASTDTISKNLMHLLATLTNAYSRETLCVRSRTPEPFSLQMA